MTTFKNILKTLSKIIGVFFFINAFFLFYLAAQYQFDHQYLLKIAINTLIGIFLLYLGRKNK